MYTYVHTNIRIVTKLICSMRILEKQKKKPVLTMSRTY